MAEGEEFKQGEDAALSFVLASAGISTVGKDRPWPKNWMALDSGFNNHPSCGLRLFG